MQETLPCSYFPSLSGRREPRIPPPQVARGTLELGPPHSILGHQLPADAEPPSVGSLHSPYLSSFEWLVTVVASENHVHTMMFAKKTPNEIRSMSYVITRRFALLSEF